MVKGGSLSKSIPTDSHSSQSEQMNSRYSHHSFITCAIVNSALKAEWQLNTMGLLFGWILHNQIDIECDYAVDVDYVHRALVAACAGNAQGVAMIMERCA